VEPHHLERTLRRLILVLLVLGLSGLGIELWALGHYEEPWQWAPLVLIASALVTVCWHVLSPSAATVTTLRLIMVLMVAGGGLGLVLHAQANIDSQLEMDPTLHGWALFLKVVHTKLPPALAPGALAQLGLLGLVYTIRDPALETKDRREKETQS